MGFFLFWSDVHPQQEDQQLKRHTDKGKVMMKKLGHTAKPADKDNVKDKKVAKQVKVDSQFKMSSDFSKDKYSLFAGENVQPNLQLPLVADT